MSNLEEKAGYFMDKILDHLEDIADSGIDDTPKKIKVHYVGSAGADALATVLEHNGWVEFFRLVYGAIVTRFKHPGLVEI